MKIKTFTSLLALIVLGLAATATASAQSAQGSYQFSLEDGYTKYVEFDAATQTTGQASGQMFFSDEAEFFPQDVDGTGEVQESFRGISYKVQFDGLVTSRTRQAVMSGVITESTVSSLVGQRVLLTVEDGDGFETTDKLTWGRYEQPAITWTPSDAELEVDPGVGLTWVATDAERREDEGYSMPRDTKIGTKTFPLSSFDFFEPAQAAGEIRVQP
ncbi:MAG TPA: hypothetical protein VN256_01160 [Pyrinomonadaceae bacterium]|nr:hypothetical protein [Pyrinomonadaceae bacterium]